MFHSNYILQFDMQSKLTQSLCPVINLQCIPSMAIFLYKATISLQATFTSASWQCYWFKATELPHKVTWSWPFKIRFKMRNGDLWRAITPTAHLNSYPSDYCQHLQRTSKPSQNLSRTTFPRNLSRTTFPSNHTLRVTFRMWRHKLFNPTEFTLDRKMWHGHLCGLLQPVFNKHGNYEK